MDRNSGCARRETVNFRGSSRTPSPTNGQHVQVARSKPKARPFGPEGSGGLIQRFIGELESPPVHCKELLRPEVQESLNCLLRIHVLRLHKPGRVVSTDWKHGCRQARETPTNLREASEIGRIA